MVTTRKEAMPFFRVSPTIVVLHASIFCFENVTFCSTRDEGGGLSSHGRCCVYLLSLMNALDVTHCLFPVLLSWVLLLVCTLLLPMKHEPVSLEDAPWAGEGLELQGGGRKRPLSRRRVPCNPQDLRFLPSRVRMTAEKKKKSLESLIRTSFSL